MQKLLIAIPCYNEESSISKAINSLPRQIEGFEKVEILVVNDGSTDKSEDIIKQHNIDHYHKFNYNNGLAKVYEKSVEICLVKKFDVMVFYDADCQYNSKDITRLCEPILKKKAQVVIGYRDFFSIKHFSLIKKILQVVGNKAFSYLLFGKINVIKDFTSGFRAVHKDVLKKLCFYTSFSYTVESIVNIVSLDQKITQIKIDVNEVKRKSRLFKSNFDFIGKQTLTLFKVMMIHKPLKILSKISLFLFFVSSIIFLRYFYFFFLDQGSDHLASLLAGSLLFISSIIVLVLALIADQISINRLNLQELKNKIDKNNFE